MIGTIILVVVAVILVGVLIAVIIKNRKPSPLPTPVPSPTSHPPTPTPSGGVARTLQVWFTSFPPTTYGTRIVSTGLDAPLGVDIEIYYAGLEVAEQSTLAGAQDAHSEFMTEAKGHKIVYAAGESGGKSSQIDTLSNDYSNYNPGYFTISSGFKIRDLGDMSTDWIVDGNPATNDITLSNGDTLNFEFFNQGSGMPQFGVSP